MFIPVYSLYMTDPADGLLNRKRRRVYGMK